jgi:hypothetical protein
LDPLSVTMSYLRSDLIVWCVLLSSLSVPAQSDSLTMAIGKLRPHRSDSVERPGTIVFHTSGQLDSLEKSLRGKEEIPGYRIQIFLGNATEAKSLRQKALGQNMGLSVNMVQNIPNYALRLGDFRSSLEAHQQLSLVRSYYPAAFVVPDRINPPKLQKRKD